MASPHFIYDASPVQSWYWCFQGRREQYGNWIILCTFRHDQMSTIQLMLVPYQKSSQMLTFSIFIKSSNFLSFSMTNGGKASNFPLSVIRTQMPMLCKVSSSHMSLTSPLHCCPYLGHSQRLLLIRWFQFLFFSHNERWRLGLSFTRTLQFIGKLTWFLGD